MNAIDTDDLHADHTHEGFPTLVELASLFNGCDHKRIKYQPSETSHYEFKYNISEEIQYRVTATIVGMTLKRDEMKYTNEVRAEEVEFDTHHPVGDEIALEQLETPKDVSEYMNDPNNKSQVYVEAYSKGALFVAISEPNDPFDRTLRTLAPIDNIWRNGDQIYPPVGAAHPQP